MINFLKAIRQQLLTEGKFGKYLIYAIGEIALVMIGILLALQVNNWNELRKEKIEEQQYLRRLRNDLQKDGKMLAFSKELSTIRIEQINLLTSVIENPNLEIKKPRKFIESIEKVTWRSYLSLSRVVYKELQSSGRMSMIRSNELREQLAVYYRDADHWEMILELQAVQKDFIRATAGLLTAEMLGAIENTESTEYIKSLRSVDIEIDKNELDRIAKGISSNEEAIKWLPKIYHYHILVDKIIDHLLEQRRLLVNSIEAQLENS